MAYMWPQSLTPWLDPYGDPYSGAKAFFFDANTTTPKVTYTDSSMGIPHDHPVAANGSGRFPAIFMEGGDYRVRIETAAGVTIEDVDGISIPDIDGGSSGGDTPETLLFRTGMIICQYANSALSGFVRLNGRTIGNAASGASERANDDTEDLFIHLWNADPNLEVSGGRGSSALSDFSANKAIELPNAKGRTFYGLAGMGSPPENVIPNDLVDDGDNNTLGATVGLAEVVLMEEQLPAHSHTGTAQSAGAHRHSIPARNFDVSSGNDTNRLSRASTGSSGTGTFDNMNSAGAHTHPLSINNTGDDEGHNNLSPGILITWYMKL